ILQAAGDSIKRLRVVQRNSIVLAGRKMIEVIPRLAPSVALINTTIGSENQPLRDWRFLLFFFFRPPISTGSRQRRGRSCWSRPFVTLPSRKGRALLNGECMTVGMHFLREIFPKILSPFIRRQHRHPQHINALRIRRIDPDLAKVKWAGIDVARPYP